MTTLHQTIKNNALLKQGGSLSETSTEELGSLSDATGRAANPISPLGAKMLGANPNQVKMAGADANKAASLNASVSGDLSLRDSVRQSQASTQSTATEKERMQKEQDLQKLKGTLDGRVQLLAEQKLGGNTGFQAKPAANPAKVATMFPSMDAAGQGRMTAAVSKLMTDPSDMESVLSVAQGLGLDTNMSADQLLSKVNQVIDSEKDSLSGLAAGVDDAIKVSDIFGTPEAIQELGDPSRIASALGLDKASFEKMDVPALKAAMEAEGLKSFSDVADLQRRLDDPYTSPSERSALTRQLQRLGASGVRGTEADYKQIQDAVNSSDLVQVGGKTYSTTELLADTNVSAMVADYLTDPEAKEKLAGTPLAAFIEKNRAVLQQASANLSGAAKGLVEINQANRNLSKTTGGAPIPDGVMKAFFPTWGAMSSSKLDPSSSPEYQNFLSMDAGTQAALLPHLSGIKDPALIKDLTGANKATLNSLIASNPAGLGNWIEFRTRYEDAARAEPADAVSKLLGVNPAEFVDSLKEYQNAKRTGYLPAGFSVPMADLLDANHDGALDDPATLKATLLQRFSSEAKNMPGNFKEIPDTRGEMSKLNEIAQNASPMYSIVRDAIKGDGIIGTSEMSDIIAAGAKDSDLVTLRSAGASQKAPGVAAAIDEELTRRAEGRVENMLSTTYGREYGVWKQAEASGSLPGKRDAAKALISALQTKLKEGGANDKAAIARAITKYAPALSPGTTSANAIKILRDVLSGVDPHTAILGQQNHDTLSSNDREAAVAKDLKSADPRIVAAAKTEQAKAAAKSPAAIAAAKVAADKAAAEAAAAKKKGTAAVKNVLKRF